VGCQGVSFMLRLPKPLGKRPMVEDWVGPRARLDVVTEGDYISRKLKTKLT
jgi:hypothetical protein